jgi:hypothetical protein
MYYRIRHSIITKNIGRKYPQVERVLIPTTWEDPLFIQSFVGKEAPLNVLLPTPILYKSSKVTDLISAATVGLSLNLLVSDKLFSILKNSKSFGIQFFRIHLLENTGIKHTYWIVHPYNSYYEILNLRDSEIGYYRDMQYTKLIRLIKAFDFISLRKEINDFMNREINDISIDENLCIRHISFNEKSDIDFFALQHVTGGIGYYISERLKSEIEKTGCTGIVFKEPNEQYP